MQQEYWTDFLAALSARGKVRHSRSPHARQWMTFPLGSTRAHLWAEMYRRDRIIGVGVTFRNAVSPETFRKLQPRADELARELGFTLEWEENAGSAKSYAGIYMEIDPADRGSWPDQHIWMADKLEKLQQVFEARIGGLTGS
jgi:hypothetical protein